MGNYFLLSISGYSFFDSIYKLVTQIRLSSIEKLNIIPIATGLAALFLIFRFIGLVRDIEEDNEGSGFGHIKLWDAILRPLLFFALTINCGTIVKGVDGAMGGITDSISSITGESENDFYKALCDASDEYDKEAQKILDKYKEDLDAGQGFLGKLFKNVYQILLQWHFQLQSIITKWIIQGLVGAFQIIYQLIMLIMVGTSQINLIVLGVMMPFSFALSILNSYKDNFKKVIGYYVEYLMWRPIILIIIWLSNVVYQSISPTLDSTIKEITGGGAGASVLGAAITPALKIIAITLILVLCFSCLSQVPSLANKVLSLGSPVEKDSKGIAEKTMSKLM